MKPTQQEIIELAREAHRELVTIDYPGHIAPLDPWTMRLCERFAALLLERFGAGGGEPMAFVHWPLSGAPRLVWYGYKALNAAILKAYEGHQPDMLLYNHPSPTDLRAEYLRGLGEGFKEGWIECSKWAQRDDLIADIGSPSYEACVSAVKALKGKQ